MHLCVGSQRSKQKWYGKNQICILVLCYSSINTCFEHMCSWTKIRQSDKIFDWRCTLQYWCLDIWSSTFVWNVKVRVVEVLLYLFNFCMKFVPKFCSSWKALFQVIVFWNTCKSLFQVLLYFNFGVKFVIKVLFILIFKNGTCIIDQRENLSISWKKSEALVGKQFQLPGSNLQKQLWENQFLWTNSIIHSLVN